MGELINFCFNSGDKEFIGVVRYGAIWTNSQGKWRLSFNKTFLKLVINCLLNNSYFALASMCFRQFIGILLGSDPVPIYGKLGFVQLRKEGVSSHKKWDKRKVHIFSNIIRFIEDLCTFNDD